MITHMDIQLLFLLENVKQDVIERIHDRVAPLAQRYSII